MTQTPPVEESTLIFAYTRKNALDDGMLLDARRGEFAEVSQQHHPSGIPIYITASLHNLMDQAIAKERWQSYQGIWHDVLTMCKVYVRTIDVGDNRPFPVIIGASNSQPHTVYVNLDGEALTFMLREDL